MIFKCKICRKEINKAHDLYAHIKEYGEGQLQTEAYFHRTCYNDALNKVRLDKQSQQMQDMANSLSLRAHAMFDQMGIDKVIPVG